MLWLIGPAKTKELIFAAEIIDADYAKMLGKYSCMKLFLFRLLGIVNHVHENPMELCEAIAEKILQNGNFIIFIL